MEPQDTNEPERMLEHLDTPAARPEFRARLREAFVSADASGQVDLEAALGAFAPPAARADFKDELRARFVRGSMGEAPVRIPQPARTQSRRLRLVAGGLGVVAAAAAILLFLRPRDAALGWVIERSVAALDDVRVDDQPLAAGRTASDLERALEGAQELSTGSTPLTLRLADQFVILMEAESTLELAALDADPTTWQLHARRGHFRVRTGPEYDPRTRLLRFTTPHAQVEAHGTIFGIDIDPGGTCTCCLESVLKGNYRSASSLDEIPDDCSLYLSASPSVAPRMCSKAPHLPDLLTFQTTSVDIWR